MLMKRKLCNPGIERFITEKGCIRHKVNKAFLRLSNPKGSQRNEITELHRLSGLLRVHHQQLLNKSHVTEASNYLRNAVRIEKAAALNENQHGMLCCCVTPSTNIFPENTTRSLDEKVTLQEDYDCHTDKDTHGKVNSEELNGILPDTLSVINKTSYKKKHQMLTDLDPVHNETASEFLSAKSKQHVFFEESFQNSTTMLCNYLQACLYSGLIPYALNLLELRIASVYVSKSTNSNQFMYSPSKAALDPQVYDVVLARLASISPNSLHSCNLVPESKQASPLDIIRKIFGAMHRLKIKPSASAYASVLEALDKVPDQKVVLALCIQQIENDGYTLDEIIGSCNAGSKSAKHVKSSIQRVLEFNESDQGLKNSFSTEEKFENLSPLVHDLYKEKPKPGAIHINTLPNLNKNYSEQIELEKGRLLEVNSILNVGEDSQEKKLKKQHLANMLEEWRESLLQTFQDLKKVEKIKHANENWQRHFAAGAGGKVFPFLCLLPEKEYVDVIINHLCRTINGGNFTASVSHTLGEEVYTRFTVSRLKETGILQRLQAVYKEYAELYTDKEKQSNYIPRHLWLELEEKHGLTNLEEKLLPWTSYWSLMVGMKLIEVMNTVTFVPQRYLMQRGQLKTKVTKHRVPAIFNSYVVRGKKQFGMTIPHPEFRALLRDALDKLIFESEVAPMVVPPRPWYSITRGGFLVNQVDFVKCKISMEDEGVKIDPTLALNGSKLGSIYDSLNILGSVAWVINKPILDLQIEYFRNKGNKDLSIPQPSIEDNPMPDLSSVPPSDVEEFKKLRQQAVEVLKTRKEMHGLFMEALYKLSIANLYRDRVFWFPHSIDFRGRFYPAGKLFNYMGSDVYRALFLFAEGQPLGTNGLDWLKIHCVNLIGLKKHSSIEERLAYANEIMNDILASADNPKAQDALWKTSDEPWQTLATCMEIARAVRSPDPSKFISKLPVHQDGSCNGLQHYAAMGRDVLGAQQVNLAPSNIPQDVYMGVAAKVEALRKQDAEKGNMIAMLLDGFVQRKVVKQTIMTTVYGVTRYGGMHQIKRQLAYLEDEFPKEQALRGGSYLVDKVFKSLTEMFTSAINIQNWLIQLADVLSRMGHAVEWETPLNLLVTQPYYKESSKFLSSPFQRLRLLESDSNIPNGRKQRNAFPPNFVHSLDSTHMMLTSLHCYSAGVTFASVHDCFWTHACNIDNMNKICREQFIALHSQPILHQLADHLTKYIPHEREETEWTKHELRLKELINQVPTSGNFNLNEVKDSTFFFS